MKQRQPKKQPDMRPPRDTQARGVSYTEPRVNKNRDDIHAVTAYSPGIKGQQQKRRKWY